MDRDLDVFEKFEAVVAEAVRRHSAGHAGVAHVTVDAREQFTYLR